MEFWNSLLTQKSYNMLIELRKKPINFILIGGWAIYFWTKMQKSKDIDIIIDYEALEYLKKNFDLKKNDNLKKYEIIIDEIDIDIYVPYFSNLGISFDNIISTKIENFNVANPECLLILKQFAEQQRENSIKGEKDRIDIMALLFFSQINFEEYFRILELNNLTHFPNRLKKIITSFKQIKYLSISPREFKLKKAEILENISKIRFNL